MNQVSVIILGWNSLTYLQKFLPALIKNTPADLADIVVVDNCSSDNSIAWLADEYPQIIVHALDRNYGYAGGYNRALMKIETPYAVLLNSDVAVTPGWIDHLVNFMNQHPQAGAAAPKIRSFQQRDYFEYAGAAGGYLDRYGYPFCRGRIFDHIEKDHGQFDEPAKVFWASGACMMVRTEAFRVVGGFDSIFFAHMEEIDLCWRMQKCGYDIWYTPDSIIYHVGGGTLPNESPHKLFLNFRNNLLLLKKNLPLTIRFRVIFTRKILDGIAAIQYLIKGKPAFFMAVLKAHIDYYRLWKKYYSHRTGNKDGLSYPRSGWYKGSIVVAYFFRRKKTFDSLIHQR